MPFRLKTSQLLVHHNDGIVCKIGLIVSDGDQGRAASGAFFNLLSSSSLAAEAAAGTIQFNSDLSVTLDGRVVNMDWAQAAVTVIITGK